MYFILVLENRYHHISVTVINAFSDLHLKDNVVQSNDRKYESQEF